MKPLISLVLGVALLTASVTATHAQAPIEGELVLITPVSKFIHDAALKAFAEYAKETWNVSVRTAALPAGTPVAYGRIVEWKGRPEADIFWGGESALFAKLAEQKLLQKVEIARELWESIPAAIGKPTPIPLKDRDGFWVLSMHGEEKGWEWLKRLAANTGHFTARSRDVPTVVAKGEYAAGFAVPSYMAFEERLAGFDIKFVAPKNAFVTPEPMAILAGARNPRAARAFVEFLLTERGQRVFMERGLFPITPKYRVQGPPGSTAEKAVEFTGGVRSYFETEVSNVYDEAVAAKRSEALKTRFRSDIEAVWKKP
jgi:iron(III) transport system substrate-binding protein